MDCKVFSTSAYKSKYKIELEKLKSQSQLNFIKNCQITFQDEEFADTKIAIKGQYFCFNKCVAFALKQDLLQLLQKSSEEEVRLDDQHLNEDEIKEFNILYSPEVTFIGSFDKLCLKFKVLLDSTLTETFHDVVFELKDDTKFKCHKLFVGQCSEYFKAMLFGSWLESSKGIVKIMNINKNVFQCILNFVYYAEVEMPTDIEVIDTMMAQDMLNIQGFLDVIKLHLKAYYFHFYHQPCDVCLIRLTNIYKFFMDSQILGFEELISSCDQWYIKHFAKILSNKNLLKIPKQVREIVVSKTTESINDINIIGIIKDIVKIKGSLPNVKWGVEATKLFSDIELFCLKYTCAHFKGITETPGFLFCLLEEKNIHINKMILEVMESALKGHVSINNCLEIHAQLQILSNSLEKELRINESKELSHSKSFITDAFDSVKLFVRKNLFKIQRTTAWKELDSATQKSLTMTSGFITAK
eukprot:TCONS_00050584-protein